MKNPTLRFRLTNGSDFPDWHDSKLGNLCKVTTGNSNVDQNCTEGQYRFFDRGIEAEHFLDTYFMDKEAIIYAGEGASFLPRYFKGKFALHQRCYALYDFSGITGKYLYYYLGNCNRHFVSTAVGSTVKSLRQGCFITCPVKIPCQEEQQKIAEFFTALDEKIASVEKQSEQLMKIREKIFSIFADLPEIQSSPLKFLLELAVVGDVDHKMPKSVEEGIPYLMTGDLFSDTVDFDRVKKISPTDYDNLTKKIRPCRGDIVMARYASVGSVKFIEFDNKFVVSYSCAIIKCKSGVNSKFIYYSLASKYLQDQIKSFINSGTQANVGLASIKKLQIKVPNIKIQEEVANKLSDLDRYIKLKNERLNSLRVLKAAFMQQMFV